MFSFATILLPLMFFILFCRFDSSLTISFSLRIFCNIFFFGAMGFLLTNSLSFVYLTMTFSTSVSEDYFIYFWIYNPTLVCFCFSTLAMSSDLSYFWWEGNHFSYHSFPVCNAYSFPLAVFAIFLFIFSFQQFEMMCLCMIFIYLNSSCLEFIRVLGSGSYFFLIKETLWQLFIQIYFSSLFFHSSFSDTVLGCLILCQRLLMLFSSFFKNSFILPFFSLDNF